MSIQKMEMSPPLTPGTGAKTIKRELSDERLLPHPCMKCTARFPTGSKLLQHMREEHAEFSDNRQPSVPSPPSDNERFRNTTAICPMCHQDCQTRRKLMTHLEVDHKDDNDHDEEPQIKYIRISNDDENKKILEQLKQQTDNVAGPFITPVAGSQSNNVMQNLLKAIGGGSKAPSSGKMEAKSSTKFQYKCFWCDASYRKRGKLMDHIDNLHKHNKQAEKQISGSLEDSKPMNGSHHMGMMGHNSSLDRRNSIGVPQFIPGLPPFHSMTKQSIANTANHVPQHPTTCTSMRPKSAGPCSFTLSGSLTAKPKLPAKENKKPEACQFFMTKKENPLANINSNPITASFRVTHERRRSSVPNLFDTSSPPFGFPFRNPYSTMATAAMQQRYLMSQMRAPAAMMPPAPFYATQMPLMLPGTGSTDYLLNQTQQMLEHQTSSQAQFFAHMNAFAQNSPLARPKNPESPLDLTKSYL